MRTAADSVTWSGWSPPRQRTARLGVLADTGLLTHGDAADASVADVLEYESWSEQDRRIAHLFFEPKDLWEASEFTGGQ